MADMKYEMTWHVYVFQCFRMEWITLGPILGTWPQQLLSFVYNYVDCEALPDFVCFLSMKMGI